MNIPKNHETKDEYHFLVHKLKYIFDDSLKKDIDCVVCEFFPVNDFTMNDLIYDKLKEEIINDILNKKTYLYHGARTRIKTNGRYSKFLERDWNIIHMKQKESDDLMCKKLNIISEDFSFYSKAISHATYNFLK